MISEYRIILVHIIFGLLLLLTTKCTKQNQKELAQQLYRMWNTTKFT